VWYNKYMNPYTYHSRKIPTQTFGVKAVAKAVLTSRVNPLLAFSLILFVATSVAVMVFFAQFSMEPGGQNPIASRPVPTAQVLGVSTSTNAR